MSNIIIRMLSIIFEGLNYILSIAMFSALSIALLGVCIAAFVAVISISIALLGVCIAASVVITCANIALMTLYKFISIIPIAIGKAGDWFNNLFRFCLAGGIVVFAYLRATTWANNIILGDYLAISLIAIFATWLAISLYEDNPASGGKFEELRVLLVGLFVLQVLTKKIHDMNGEEGGKANTTTVNFTGDMKSSYRNKSFVYILSFLGVALLVCAVIVPGLNFDALCLIVAGGVALLLLSAGKYYYSAVNSVNDITLDKVRETVADILIKMDAKFSTTFRGQQRSMKFIEAARKEELIEEFKSLYPSSEYDDIHYLCHEGKKELRSAVNGLGLYGEDSLTVGVHITGSLNGLFEQKDHTFVLDNLDTILAFLMGNKKDLPQGGVVAKPTNPYLMPHMEATARDYRDRYFTGKNLEVLNKSFVVKDDILPKIIKWTMKFIAGFMSVIFLPIAVVLAATVAVLAATLIAALLALCVVVAMVFGLFHLSRSLFFNNNGFGSPIIPMCGFLSGYIVNMIDSLGCGGLVFGVDYSHNISFFIWDRIQAFLVLMFSLQIFMLGSIAIADPSSSERNKLKMNARVISWLSMVPGPLSSIFLYFYGESIGVELSVLISLACNIFPLVFIISYLCYNRDSIDILVGGHNNLRFESEVLPERLAVNFRTSALALAEFRFNGVGRVFGV